MFDKDTLRLGRRFIIVGAGNTLIGLGIIYTMKYFLSFSDWLANVVGYGVGIIISYLTNCRWTFEYKAKIWSAFWRFILTVGIAYFVQFGVVMFLILKIHVNGYVAQCLGLAPYVALTFILSKKYVFVTNV